jgi:hypothetical protein
VTKRKVANLVPRHLAVLIDCPYTGTPLRYAPGKVWSIGPDGKDDGGVPQVDEDKEESDGDIVWDIHRK